MPLKIPQDLKKITQYVRRAEELDKDSSPQTRIVAYYARQYAAQLGLPIASNQAAKECLGKILDSLETERKAMSNFTKDEAYLICREFALKIFDKADSIDRAGQSDKVNAKTFYAAASFLDILRQFNNEDEKSDDVIEEEKKSFYAKWKATDILKAIRLGIEVKPGGYGEELHEDEAEGERNLSDDNVKLPATLSGENFKLPEEGTEVCMDGTGLETPPPPPPYPGIGATDVPYGTAPTYNPVANESAAPVKRSSFISNIFGGGDSKSTGRFSKAVLSDAKELTNFALKALDAKDGDLAIERLQQALETLTQV
mmetsp:Transcript_24860/g.30558  ORF Transcript_24860/g.30558 Transcript_24860/m.30558 type:complete len:313 (+) Transcript_24860:46-984(+)